jgi:dedicator of cytokinesis protein 1
LSLDIGDAVNILSYTSDWCYGFAVKNRDKRGIFPKSFISIRDSVIDSSGAFETILPKEPPIVLEITAVLREWGTLWKELYLQHLIVRRTEEEKEPTADIKSASAFHTISLMMNSLVNWRRLIMSRKLTVDELKDLQQKITNMIDVGNAKLGLDLVVRDEHGNILDPMRTSTISLYRLHHLATKRIEKEKEVVFERHAPPKKISSFNLYVNVKKFCVSHR